MQYDITSKVIFERCKGAILRFLCKLDIAEIKEIELLRAIKEALEVATSLEEIKEFLKQN